jgi:cobalt-zinc-cadmium efflux system outer membrane protein
MKYKIFTNTKNNNTMVSKNTIKLVLTISYLLLVVNIVNSQSLDSLLQLTVENNPSLKSLQLEYEAELLKVDQVSQLPNPEIGVGIPVLRPETRLGPQVLMVSSSQMFPWFGTLKSKENVVIAMSKVKYENISALRLNLFNTIKQAYFELNFLNEKETIINEFLFIYQSLENISLSKVESGQSTIVDVLRIQLIIQEFEYILDVIENERIIFYGKINEITNQPLQDEIRVFDDLGGLDLLEFDIDTYRKKINLYHPLMVKLNQEVELSKSKQQLNSNINKPLIGVGVDYSLVNPRVDANPINNGQDILIPKVKVSIPLYRKSYAAVNNQEDNYQQSLIFQKESIENKMIRLLLQYKSEYDNAVLNVELNIIQIATVDVAYQVLLSQYSSESKGFDDLLQIQNQLLNYKLGLAKSNLLRYKMIANIDRLTDY